MSENIRMQPEMRRHQLVGARFVHLLLVALALIVCLLAGQAAAGNKGNKGQEDIIMYNGNIVLRGDKKGGSIVLANNHPSHEEVEYVPSYFGDKGGLWR